MTVFSRYAEFYDLTYSEKAYAKEVEFILNKLSLNSAENLTLLELGCGTGRHGVEFIDRGFDVFGIDISPEMVGLAKERITDRCSIEKSTAFSVGDVRTADLGRQFDVVVSLFHVFSYQTENKDLSAAFHTAASHLAPGGRLFIDFWYGPAVLSDPPRVRVRRLQGKDFAVTRIAEPKSHPNKNVVDVNYELIFEPDNEDEEVSHVNETHRMRYLFLPEIDHFLSQAGLRLVDSGKWMSDEGLGKESWYGWLVAEHAHG